MGKSSRIALHVEYAALRMLETTATAFSRPAALSIGAMLGSLLYIAGGYRRVVRMQMEHVGFADRRQRAAITWRLYRNMGRYCADFLRASSNAPPYRATNLDLVDPIFARGRGAIALLAHFGNWEILANIFGSKIGNLHVLARPMANPLVERWLIEKRRRTGVIPVYAAHALRKSLRVLEKNGMVAMLIDQNARQHGTMVPFLGKPANTIRTVAGLMLKTGCAVVPAFAILDEKGTYDVFIDEAPRLDIPHDKPDDFIAAHQAYHNQIVSGWIRRHPEHWFGWFHRRFRGAMKYAR